MSDSLVIIPTYNEKENVENIIRKIFSMQKEYNILIVDDGSPDDTAGIVKRLAGEYKGRLFLEERHGKLGLGTAYIHGFRWGLARHYEYIFEMDADFSHNPDDLGRLYEACAEKGADMSVGSRYVSGGGIKNWPLSRVLMSYFGSLYARTVLLMNIKDMTAGFICYKRKVLESIRLEKIGFVGYAFQIQMKYAASVKGFRITEVPIIFTDRKYGVSKMGFGIFREGFKGVWQMRKSRI